MIIIKKLNPPPPPAVNKRSDKRDCPVRGWFFVAGMQMTRKIRVRFDVFIVIYNRLLFKLRFFFFFLQLLLLLSLQIV